MTELERLARPRALVTRELHPFNAFYGHAQLLRRYAGLAGSRPLKAALEHGPSLFENRDDPDLRTALPRYFCAAERQARFFEANARHATRAAAIGPPILYAQALAPQPPRPARRTLLFFDAHSTHFVTSRYDVDAAVTRLESMSDEFDDVVVCLYWRDVALGRAELYRSRGFTCVTAGHMFDEAFLFRLLEIISAASVVVATQLGSAALYSALLGRPVWIEPGAVEYELAPEAVGVAQTAPEQVYADAATLFAERFDGVTAAQQSFVREVCGADEFRSPAELRGLIEEAEAAYRQEVPAGTKLRLRAVATGRLVRNVVRRSAA